MGYDYAAVENRIQIAWKKFRHLVPLLSNEDISLKVRGRYTDCIAVVCEVVCCMEVRPGL